MGVAKERLPSMMMLLLMRPGVREDEHCDNSARVSCAPQTLAVLPPSTRGSLPKN
jgi:hypothetical protein